MRTWWGVLGHIQELLWQQKPSVKTWEWGWIKAWECGLGMRLGQGLGMRLGQGLEMWFGNEAGSRLGNVVWEWGWVKAWKWGWVKVWECGLGMRLGQDHRWGCTRVCTRLGMFLYTPDRCCGIHVQGAASCSQSLNTSTLHYVVMSGFSVQAIHTLINRLHDDMSFLQQKPWVSASHWCF